MNGDLASLLPLAAAWFAVFVFSTTIHEAAHAWAALRLGDPTAYQGGQVSLNPAPHIQREPFGMVLVPLVSFFLMNGQWMIGWASAPYDPVWAQRHPKRSAWMALAGPVSNLLLVIASGLAIRIGIAVGMLEDPQRTSVRELYGNLTELAQAAEGSSAEGLATVLSIAFVLNLLLFVFNLLPLPPMDGSAVIKLVMSSRVANAYDEFLRQPMWAFVGLLLAWRAIRVIFWPILGLTDRLLYLGA